MQIYICKSRQWTTDSYSLEKNSHTATQLYFFPSSSNYMNSEEIANKLTTLEACSGLGDSIARKKAGTFFKMESELFFS